MKTIGVIPARFGSTRFPMKVLGQIGGKPLVRHVWEKACLCRQLDEVLIACDHDEVFKTARLFGAQAVMTDPHHPSGSDRIAEAVKEREVDVVVNIQGDEPFIDPAAIDALAVLLKQDAAILMATVIKEISCEADFLNPNVVKCVVDGQGNALYFSRAPIPHHRGKTFALTPKNYKHLGLYAYRKSFLIEFTRWPKGALESAEELEQLRALEHGVRIKTTVTEHESMAVDTPEDLQKANAWYAKLKSATK
ncbi:MAG: 3-deoxy-manno-octulosonate cytidylyltransferase [Candidatus Omnitrophica bacterium]|nr:3-deoxy-manno-octulosonate cytidylyltransferase [Candidatus Omnitrophota bacterium]MDE2009974.1 3-deoxy-manno-octulosonate cytidylyltransferase [Candidatus Omnitrophota bacterium]MDE2213952.1 3-deoxy-manno-octulosonate cytidylyltransferase [Candidatus Omnitrophota bacterium]MDE2231898.1 3-deoxy-manno-octulosonate cytidylyltransferase [Candidatus Omnitrophota bacterium]